MASIRTNIDTFRQSRTLWPHSSLAQIAEGV